MNTKLLHSIITRLDNSITNLSTKKSISIEQVTKVLTCIKDELLQVDPTFLIENKKPVVEKKPVESTKASILGERKGWV